MSTIELRKRLIEKIQSTDDEHLLEEAYRLLQSASDDTGIYQLNEGQKAAINEGRQQIREGNHLTDKDANNEIDEWLNE
ncbi:MAG: hypothetical protein M3Y85_12685 [Bacteroidota bacterium]|nr:hypothetical protein [Bacteroidota bacterium]